MDIADRLGLASLRYFAVLADELHFGRAAVRLGIAQPFLSQKIRALEDTLGSPLFLRTSRRVELTEAGAAFLETTRKTLVELQRGRTSDPRARPRRAGYARHRLRDDRHAHGGAGPAQGVPRDVSPGAPVAARDFHRAPAAQLRQGDLDVGFLSQPVTEPGPPHAPRLERALLRGGAERSPIGEGPEDPPQDLAREPFVSVVRWSSPDMYDRMMRDCQAAGVALNIVQEAGSWQAAISLVAAGIGVAIAPSCVSRLRFPRVRYRELSGAAPTYGLALCTGEGTLSPAVESFLESCGAGSAGSAA